MQRRFFSYKSAKVIVVCLLAFVPLLTNADFKYFRKKKAVPFRNKAVSIDQLITKGVWDKNAGRIVSKPSDNMPKRSLNASEVVEVSPDPMLHLEDTELPSDVHRVTPLDPDDIDGFIAWLELLIKNGVLLDDCELRLLDLAILSADLYDEQASFLDELRDFSSSSPTEAIRTSMLDKVDEITAKIQETQDLIEAELRVCENETTAMANAMAMAMAMAQAQA